MSIEAFPADAVCLATGGPGIVYGRSTNSTITRVPRRRAAFIDGRHLHKRRVHPGSPYGHPGGGQAPADERVRSRRVAGSGSQEEGRQRDPRRFPRTSAGTSSRRSTRSTATSCPADVASREIVYVVRNLGMGVEGQEAVYLDVTHIRPRRSTASSAAIMEIYEKFVGVDPRHTPMKIFPAVHYSMGGVWVDYEADSRNDMVPGSRASRPPTIAGLYAGRATMPTTGRIASARTRSSPASTRA